MAFSWLTSRWQAMVRQHPGSLRTDKLVGVQAYASLINAHVNRLGHPGASDIEFVLLFLLSQESPELLPFSGWTFCWTWSFYTEWTWFFHQFVQDHSNLKNWDLLGLYDSHQKEYLFVSGQVKLLGGGLKFLLCSSLCGKMMQFDYTTWKVDGATPMYWFIIAPY